MLYEIKTSYHEPLYTLTEAEKIIDLQRTRYSRQRAKEKLYYIKQKLSGLILIICGLAIPVLNNEAGMAAIVYIILGLWLLITKEKVMMFRGR